jgi:hypothetical protein
MGFHGVGADVQLSGNFLVAVAFGQQSEDFARPWRGVQLKITIFLASLGFRHKSDGLPLKWIRTGTCAAPLLHKSMIKLSRDRLQERSRSQLIRKTFQVACIPDGMQSLVEFTAEVPRPNNRGADAPSPAVEHEQPQEIGRKGSGKEERSRRSGQHVKQWKRSSIRELILTNHQVVLSPRYPAAGVVTRLCGFAP